MSDVQLELFPKKRSRSLLAREREIEQAKHDLSYHQKRATHHSGMAQLLEQRIKELENWLEVDFEETKKAINNPWNRSQEELLLVKQKVKKLSAMAIVEQFLKKMEEEE